MTICRLHSRRRNRNPSRCGHDPQGGARPAVGNQRSMAADNAAAWPRDAEIPLTDVRSVPKTGLARPPPTQQTARKGRLHLLYPMNQYAVSVYQHTADQTVFIIPMTFDERGLKVNVDKPLVLDPPYDAARLGEHLSRALEISKNEPVIDSSDAPKVYTNLTGIKSYKKFSEGRLYTSITFIAGRGYLILPHKRDARGSYVGTGEIIELPPEATELTLGEMLIESLSKCSC